MNSCCESRCRPALGYEEGNPIEIKKSNPLNQALEEENRRRNQLGRGNRALGCRPALNRKQFCLKQNSAETKFKLLGKHVQSTGPNMMLTGITGKAEHLISFRRNCLQQLGGCLHSIFLEPS